MKMNKLLALTALGLCFVANADVEPKIGLEAKKQMSKAIFSSTQAEFGAYKVEASLTRIPSSIAASEQIVATKGSMAIVNVAVNAEPELVGEGTVVRNIFTNELTTLTGHVTALLSKDATAADVAGTVGMEVISVFPGTDLAVLKIKEGTDLIEAFKGLQASSAVLESKIEVADTIYTAQ